MNRKQTFHEISNLANLNYIQLHSYGTELRIHLEYSQLEYMNHILSLEYTVMWSATSNQMLQAQQAINCCKRNKQSNAASATSNQMLQAQQAINCCKSNKQSNAASATSNQMLQAQQAINCCKRNKQSIAASASNQMLQSNAFPSGRSKKILGPPSTVYLSFTLAPLFNIKAI